MNITRYNNGNYVYLRLTGTPENVRVGATRLFNFGALATMPEIPSEGETVSVIATTYRQNITDGFLALAHTALAADKTRTRGMKGRPNLFRLAVEADALFMLNGIPVEKGIQKAKDSRIARGPSIAEIDESEEDLTPAVRKMGREIIAHYFGESRDSASRRAHSFGE